MTNQELLNRIQATSFAMTDLALYLDTHPADKSALALFRKYVPAWKELVALYEKQVGPLMHASGACENAWIWVDGAWPWENCQTGRIS